MELGVADSLAARAVAVSLDRPPAEIDAARKRSGDLGTTAEEILRGSPRAQAPALDVRGVYAGLLKIANSAGEGSQETKVQGLVELLRRASPPEAKYLVRFVLGKLRLGVREMTILDALAERYGSGTKEARAKIEAAFNLSSDLGLVAETLDSDGLDGLPSIHLEVGRPVRAMLAERATSLDDLLERMEGRAALEYKYDGLRVQAHIAADGSVKLYSRRLEDLSNQFPELVRALPKAAKRRPLIVEGECVSIDLETDEIRPFQDVSRRRGRKYDLERMEAEIPVCLFLFDTLLDGKETVMDQPFPERRQRLLDLIHPSERIRIAEQKVVDTAADAQLFFDAAIADGCEGIMGKSVAAGSAYRAGARGFWWIKYKRDYTQGLADSIDGVVVGAFHGRGRRGGRYGALLLAVYNPELDQFESFSKVGSGFDDATLAELPGRLKPHESDSAPEGVVSGLTPDRWVVPKLVMEVQGAELTLSPIHRAAFNA
ncbi:MAG TPA: ATP-dependent DNA ligase, partial [Thermoplasmata archaeon]|nr:ATP-dependent DNA ligase [Thermoplasmata archaeon]